MNAVNGDWGNVIDTTIIGIHQVVLADGRVLYWGGDGNGNAFSNTQKYGIFDPSTGQHEILSAAHAVRMFCGAGVLIPGTDQVLISGGNGSGDRGGQIFDLSEESLTRDPANEMNDGRFYPTTVSLSTGQVIVLGGRDAGTPEIFTLGEGWRDLSGATDPDLKSNWWYPRAWVNNDGEVLYVAIKEGNQNASVTQPGTLEIMALDPSGIGSIRQVGEIPFQMDVASPAAMFDVGKVVMMDHAGDLWIMDINGETPTFTFAADLNVDRNNSDMTVLPDGRVLINGGTTIGNSQDEANAVLQSVMFDPYSGEVTYVDSESVMRLYHSSSVLLSDGTILSMGGGGLGGTKNFMDAQVYSPDYLYNDDGTLADRPEISDAPDSLEPGDTFTITVDDASTIARMSFVKTGAVTHSINMESGRMDLDFNVISNTQIEVNLPDNPHVVGAGNWMLFAIDDEGVPSEAPIIMIEPTVEPFDGKGGLETKYLAISSSVNSLDQIDFSDTAIYEDQLVQADINTGGALYNGGPSDYVAIQMNGEFEVEQSGNHTFYLTSDDGSALYIDGQKVIANDGLHGSVQKQVTVDLSAGKHDVEIRYFESGGHARLDLDWAGPGFGRSQMLFNKKKEPEPQDDLVDDIPNETQYLTGVGDKDVFAIDGNASDYGWGETQDGEGIVVWGPTGHDLLYGFETIRFNDTDISLVQTGNEYIDVANVTQYLTGSSDEEETFVINGNSDDYQWGATQDGEGIVVWGPTGHDLLYDFDKITFNDQTVDLDAPNTGPQTVQDDPNLTQHLTGSDAVDRFVIDGDSSDYGWDKTLDNTGIVVWNENGHDILYDFEEIEFNDQVIDLATVA